MKRLLIATALIYSTVISAHADQTEYRQIVYKWYDTIRPGGHKRPDTVGMASVAKCRAQYGDESNGLPPGFQGCMRERGYRLVSNVDRPVW